MRRTILLLFALATALVLGILARFGELGRAEAAKGSMRVPVPVEVGGVERGSITLRRTFSGTLTAAAEFVVASKAAGRLERLEVDMGDRVERGQVVAYLDDDEFVQAVHQAEADLAVARAGLAEARSALEIADRALKRVESLHGEGVTSTSELDAARATELARRSRVAVTDANVPRAEAALELARIQLSYTHVTASWRGGADRRIVAERRVDEGGIVAANAALLSIVELDPILAVLFVPERDYARLSPGQRVTLTTDTHPGRTFRGQVARIAPVFQRSTRQARVECVLENSDEALKPGMFVRATLELEQIDDAVTVPFEALTERAGETGLFTLDAAGERVDWLPVMPGVREGDRIQILGSDLTGRVVVLGQELCDDGALVSVAEARGGASEPR